jgi:DNA-directed RNA polymerase specialized sigma24 family protein
MLKSRYELIDSIDLLEQIRDSDDNEAYKEFVQRFLPIVKDQCLIKCKLRKLDKDIGLQIAHDTFEKVRKSKSFKKEKLIGSDSKSKITGWLFRISSNLFYDFHNSQKCNNQVYDFYIDELFSKASEINVNSLAEKRDLSIKILQKLNPKEREVVLTDIEYKRSHKYLPEDANESLANRIGVKKDTVRKIRERAILKLYKAIDEIHK